MTKGVGGIVTKGGFPDRSTSLLNMVLSMAELSTVKSGCTVIMKRVDFYVEMK